MLQIVYLPTTNRVFGVHNFADVLRDAARNFIAPPVLMPKSTLLQNHQAKEYVDSFLLHCVSLFGSLLQLSGHNRARQRDKLAHLLEDFATLQDEVRIFGFVSFIFLVVAFIRLRDMSRFPSCIMRYVFYRRRESMAICTLCL